MKAKSLLDAETLSVIHQGDAVPRWMRDLIGQSAQLRIPLRDPVELRRQAAILRDMANRFEVLSQDRRPAQSIMFEAYGVVRTAQDRLKSYPRSEKIWGKKKDGLSE